MSSTLSIVIVVAGVSAAILLFLIAHLLDDEPRSVMRVTDIHHFRRGDLVTDGIDVFQVREVHAPDTLVVSRKDRP